MKSVRRLFEALAPALLAAAWVVSLLSPLLSPRQALANRDIAGFHLPLRFAFREMAAFGLPLWNPWLHGGQPLLSNPSYGAFYPPSWLVLAMPPYYALSWLALLHVGLAFAGAWRLARRLGCGRGAAALAGIGYSGCGAYLSQLSALTLLLSLAWLPWVLAWADEALRAAPGERWWRPALLAGGALSLQLLNGEPSTAVMSGLALLAFAVSAAGRQAGTGPRVMRAMRVLVPFAFAVAVAAVQILPTLGRLVDSPRSALGAEQAMHWSMPPQRLVEIVLPRFYGDAARVSEGLFFGGEISDGQYPYVESLYPGLLLLVLGVAALVRSRIPRRAAWSLAFGAGIFLALGRHNPLYAGLRRVVPVLAVLRYPEKFAILATLALVLAGVLGWQRLLDERQAGRYKAATLPLVLSLIVLAAAATLTALLLWAPDLAKPLLNASGAPFPDQRAAALPYLRGEGWAAVATAAAVAALLGLCRWHRPQRRWLSLLAMLLITVDLWHYSHRLARTVPAAVYLVPPPLAASLLPARDRIFAPPQAGPDLSPAKVANQADRASLYIARLSPYGGLLWRIPYAFDVDFDLMLTNWAQASDKILEREWPEPARSFRYLGVWNVRTVLMARRIASQPPAGTDPVLLGLSRLQNSHVLARYRFVPRVTFYPSLTAAIAAARATNWALGREEHCVQTGLPSRSLVYTQRPRLLGSADEGKRVRIHYRAEGGAFFVAATTFDEGWSGRLDGAPIAVYPTAACQIGVELPPGEHRLTLEYRDPFVPVGAAVSLFALLLGVLVYRRPRAAE
ncbi:MAG TPA: hypothetical protein VLV54_12175 [Thermoanaerobaculia bacterium]|nr:hypothetical protein [Thermoanaerobaculia bacterium]